MNGIIIIDKPSDWTSNDVVCKLRGVLHEKRVGHGGTLDPMATGVLPVFVGRATRAVQFCEADEKEYIADMRPGVITDTQDTTGRVLETRPCEITEQDIVDIIPKFLGEQEQIPPMYSAIKIGGRKLYELARKGVELERPARRITIRELELLGGGNDEYTLRIICSKGTYIRALVSDIGEALGCGAAMSSLRRIRSGVFTLDDSQPLAKVIAAAEAGEARSLLRPVDSLFSHFGAITIGPEQEKKCRNGNPLPMPGLADGKYRVYGESGGFLMLGKALEGELLTVKSFFEVG